jgi:hypothetical protein
MKAHSLSVLIGILFISVNAFTQEISEKQKSFANKFIEMVTQHNAKKVMKMMDKKYKKEQLANLNGNKEQFVNELFGGEDISDPSIYVNVKLDEVTKIEIAEVIKLKGDTKYNYIFRIRTADHDIFSSLILRQRGRKFGFIGSFG